MKLLIDTHALTWYVEQPAKLGPTVEAPSTEQACSITELSQESSCGCNVK